MAKARSGCPVALACCATWDNCIATMRVLLPPSAPMDRLAAMVSSARSTIAAPPRCPARSSACSVSIASRWMRSSALSARRDPCSSWRGSTVSTSPAIFRFRIVKGNDDPEHHVTMHRRDYPAFVGVAGDLTDRDRAAEVARSPQVVEGLPQVAAFRVDFVGKLRRSLGTKILDLLRRILLAPMKRRYQFFSVALASSRTAAPASRHSRSNARSASLISLIR